MNMPLTTDTSLVHEICMSIQVLLENIKTMLASYCLNMLASNDSNILVNVTPPIQIQIYQ